MQLILIIFILVPIIEIAVFFQVGSLLGLTTTLVIVLVTAIIGVNLLKQQGLRAWTDIQLKMTQGQVPALEMAAAAQLLFAGGLLLTPGFVTDFIGFALMFPQIRMAIAKLMYRHWSVKMSTNFQSSKQQVNQNESIFTTAQKHTTSHRIIEGEFEDKSVKDNQKPHN